MVGRIKDYSSEIVQWNDIELGIHMIYTTYSLVQGSFMLPVYSR